MAAPLIAGNNLATMDSATREILTNQEVIAIDQDPLGLQGVPAGRMARTDATRGVWKAPAAPTPTCARSWA